jgi:prepilin-type N-terminal cleavage/methylation domain-containing protein
MTSSMISKSVRSEDLPQSDGRQAGFSLIEMLVALVLLSFAAVSVASMGFMAAKLQRVGRSDDQLWHAVHYQLETLTSMDYDSVSSGSAVVRGYPMSWNVQGTDPKIIILDVETKHISGNMVHDTIVTYLDPGN